MAARANPSSVVLASLERFRGLLEDRFGARLREVVLFGSRARGDAHEESDVDVLVVIDALTPEERRVVVDLSYDVDFAGPWLGISPLAYSTQQACELRQRERRLFLDIDREGVRV
ncbi:MAG: nucleotidyltransferase domain-containing protein [Labilithrix sp.]|nr:nucleotidyltransferase domain-containing protein [Labilithrix sp.]MCW5811009.1 nucleotidyltransferase domain-containing protein [Labilithrix sp.]